MSKNIAQACADAGIDVDLPVRLSAIIERHIGEKRYFGCQIALAFREKIVFEKTFGVMNAERRIASGDTLWPLLSGTKVITAVALWTLVDQGLVSFSDPVAEHLPAFSGRGRDSITIEQVFTHQGGFPNAKISRKAWADHAALFKEIADFEIEWEPGSRVHYHPRSAYWLIAALIEQKARKDFRHVVRERIIEPLGLGHDLFLGTPVEQHSRIADLSYAEPEKHKGYENTSDYRLAGIPSSGAFGTARAMALFYQMLLGRGLFGGKRIVSARTVDFAVRNYTEERIDGNYKIPMRRGLGPHLRGTGLQVRGLGTIASRETFGHGGNGSSYSWADPITGISFSYLTNCIAAEPWHSRRMDSISNVVHAALNPPPTRV